MTDTDTDTDTDTASVRRSVVVAAAQPRAFELFTSRFDAVKPSEHNMLAVPIAETVFEPRVGGHILDRGTDGSECRWARVLVFDPPERIVFSWDISPSWQLVTDPELTSEVEVRFVPDGPDRTRVELEHRHLDRHGPDWPNLRGGLGTDDGWSLYLARLSDLAITAS